MTLSDLAEWDQMWSLAQQETLSDAAEASEVGACPGRTVHADRLISGSKE